MKKYKWLLFDLDGTLIYSHPGIFSCMRLALQEMNEDINPTDAFLRQTVGPPLEYTFEHIFGMGEKRALEATKAYRRHYAKTGVLQNELIPGALEMLISLKNAGYILAMATSKPQRFADQIANRLDIAKYFTKIVGCGLDGELPTKSDVVAEAIKRLGAEKEKTLMIGDRHHDHTGAVDNQIDCALVDIGYAEEGEIERCAPTIAAKTIDELLKNLL